MARCSAQRNLFDNSGNDASTSSYIKSYMLSRQASGPCRGHINKLMLLRQCIRSECHISHALSRTLPLLNLRESSSSTRWKSRQGRDSFAREAKVQGLKSRAAFKLLEVDDTRRQEVGIVLIWTGRLMQNMDCSRRGKQ